MAVTVQEVFRKALPSLLKQRNISTEMIDAAQRIINCRTEAMGTRLVYCPNGCTSRETYNSCRQRSCPQCAPMAREHWLQGWKERLLDCPHFHIVFTVPQELRTLWQYNKRTFAQCLLKAASEALLELLADPKYLGARPGILAGLHTWSQTLAMHPHVHTIVTAGGLDSAGRWKHAVKSCLLPRKVLMLVFRGKLRSHLQDSLKRGDLQPPGGSTVAQLRGLLNKIGRMVLNVKILEQYAHGLGIASYLARYLHGGPLGSRRLEHSVDGRIRFRARRNEGDPAERHGEVRLTAEALTLRLLEHVAPSGMQTIRSYGLYGSHYRKDLNVARAQCKQRPVNRLALKRQNWQSYCESRGHQEACRCRHCNSVLQSRVIPYQERPPPLDDEIEPGEWYKQWTQQPSAR